MTAQPIGDCFRCGKPGHWHDNCPLQIPATSREEHEGRIAEFVRRFFDWEITARQKQALIRDENNMWKARKA